MYRILLVDDDYDDAEIIRTTIRDHARWSCQVVHVDCIADAEWQVRNNRFDLLLVDYQLKSGYGPQHGTDFIRDCFARGLRVPTILISGHPRVLLDQEILGLCATSDLQFLSKNDLSPGTLLSAVYSSLSRVIHLLVMHDDEGRAQELERIFGLDEFHRFRVTTTSSIAEAMELLRTIHVDVVVASSKMPEHSGMQLIDQVIYDQLCPDAAFFLLSAADDLQNHDSALRLIGRRRVEFCSETSLTDTSIIPAVVRCRNEALLSRYRPVQTRQMPLQNTGT